MNAILRWLSRTFIGLKSSSDGEKQAVTCCDHPAAIAVAYEGAQLGAERERLIDRYLTLMQDCLTGSIYEDPPINAWGLTDYDPQVREVGRDWPTHAHTMIGRRRMQNLRDVCETVLAQGIPGDFIETGVWRGGACIMMRAILEAYDVKDRCVWLADSFEGLPRPDAETYPEDAGDTFHTYTELAVTLDQVRANFKKYGLLDDNVKFLKGWFRDTLPVATVRQLAVLRLDGDMYESTILALECLYPKLVVGGYVIIDDYHIVPACRQAISDYCASLDISPKIEEIDGLGVFWRKEGSEGIA